MSMPFYSLRLILLLFLFPYLAYSQSVPPKREFRGVWIATVANIDWPSRKGLSSLEQQQEFGHILDEHRKNGINAVVVQVRPATDAFYRSQYEPWSQWLTGRQGTEPAPYYDPLAFMIAESHRRGMEFHAWFNPYRATFDTVSANISPLHITRQCPEWFFTYGGKKLFDPGLPPVREYIVRVIMDVVRRYDIDGVHFDDYFYPYPVTNDTIRDDSTFTYYSNGFTSKDDWRRNNVNLLIAALSDSIRQEKPHVKFGISPFGVWKNQSEDPFGSDTNAGQTSFTHLYADSREWLLKGWIDYIVPQIYFSIGYPPASYDKLLDWWTKNSYRRHLYVGQGAYKINNNADTRWLNPQETPNQLRLNRSYPAVQGSVYFSSKVLLKNPNHVADSLRSDFYRYPALPPVMPWKDSIPPLSPVRPEGLSQASGILLKWEAPTPARDSDTAHYYIIYRFDRKQTVNLNDPRHILAIHREPTRVYEDCTVERKKRYVYAITAIDRLHNESEAVQLKVRARRKLMVRKE